MIEAVMITCNWWKVACLTSNNSVQWSISTSREIVSQYSIYQMSPRICQRWVLRKSNSRAFQSVVDRGCTRTTSKLKSTIQEAGRKVSLSPSIKQYNMVRAKITPNSKSMTTTTLTWWPLTRPYHLELAPGQVQTCRKSSHYKAWTCTSVAQQFSIRPQLILNSSPSLGRNHLQREECKQTKVVCITIIISKISCSTLVSQIMTNKDSHKGKATSLSLSLTRLASRKNLSRISRLTCHRQRSSCSLTRTSWRMVRRCSYAMALPWRITIHHLAAWPKLLLNTAIFQRSPTGLPRWNCAGPALQHFSRATMSRLKTHNSASNVFICRILFLTLACQAVPSRKDLMVEQDETVL